RGPAGGPGAGRGARPGARAGAELGRRRGDHEAVALVTNLRAERRAPLSQKPSHQLALTPPGEPRVTEVEHEGKRLQARGAAGVERYEPQESEVDPQLGVDRVVVEEVAEIE